MLPHLLTALTCAMSSPTPPPQGPEVPYVETRLDNGLRVVVHEDHSDPVVAVYVCYHVGSAREEPGRSGFAHLFEHMLFQGSQHVGDDEHFKLVSEAGGTLNGTTNRDRTLYYETLPANQLELALWLEADRMGFLLPAVTQAKLDNQREVVRNERRQNYENRPYGQARAALAEAMFPAGHPYSWLTIGTHADLEAATLEDVHAFFRRWYGPDNAVLVIAGDVQPDQALAAAQRWFGPIPRGPQVPAPRPQPATLDQDVRLVQEDDVQLPQLSLSWPGTVRYDADDAALDLLAMVLSENRSAVLDRALTVERVLARRVSAANSSGEVAGTFDITVQAAPGVDLETLEGEVQRLLAELVERGVDEQQLARLRTRYEADFVRRLETVSAKASALAQYATFVGEPGWFSEDLRRHLDVTAEDVRSVLRRYLVGRPRVVLSVVPSGRLDLAASGRTPDQVAAEASLERARRPGPGPRPTFRSPEVWRAEIGPLRVAGTPYGELPLTTLALSIPGGRVHERADQLGLSSLTAGLMGEGTRELATTELADALDALGADLSVRAGDDEITLTLGVLDKHLPEAARLLLDVLLEPRLDAEDFERLKAQRLAAIDTRGDSIRRMAANAWSRLMYGEGALLGQPAAGTRETIERLTVEDVRAFHAAALRRGGARAVLASGLDAAATRALLEPLLARWPGPEPADPGTLLAGAPAEASAAGDARLFLVDKPGAAQSEVRVGHMSVASTDPDWWALQVLNYGLGGAFSSRVNMNLREDKGWTYGARTAFAGGLRPAPFAASTSVQAEFTAPAVAELLRELEGILEGPTAEELEFTRSALTQAQLRRYESARARLGLVDSISRYGWPDDLVERRLDELEACTVEALREVARRHIDPDRARVLVIGDRETVLPGLVELGLGPVVELDLDGRPLAAGD